MNIGSVFQDAGNLEVKDGFFIFFVRFAIRVWVEFEGFEI